MIQPAIVGVTVVRDENRFVERALRNVAGFCDRLIVVDNGSTDGTWEALSALADEFDHLTLRREPDLTRTHALVEPFVGTPTWVFGVDGDELYDPAGLAQLQEELRSGVFGAFWRIKSNVLNVIDLDEDAGLARGHLSPPSRPSTKLFNFSALQQWSPPAQFVFHGGTQVFRPGFHDHLSENVGDRLGWDESHFRMLHCCFVARSTREDPDAAAKGRQSSVDLRASGFRRHLSAARRRLSGAHAHGSDWKNDKYRRGPIVTVDASPFITPASAHETGASRAMAGKPDQSVESR